MKDPIQTASDLSDLPFRTGLLLVFTGHQVCFSLPGAECNP